MSVSWQWLGENGFSPAVGNNWNKVYCLPRQELEAVGHILAV